MTKHSQIYIILFFLFLTSCISENIQNAASKAALNIMATKYKVGNGTSAGTNSESFKSLNIEFSDFEGVPNGFTNEQLSSSAAYEFYNNLKSPDYSGYDKIKVTLNKDNTTTVTLFDIKEMSEIDKHFKAATNLIKGISEKSITSVQSIIDTAVITKSIQNDFSNLFVKLDSAYGPIKDNVFKGFKFTETKEEKTPVFVTWCELQHDSAVTDIKIGINRTTGKIFYIGINEEYYYR